jgi:hypothetical protein
MKVRVFYTLHTLSPSEESKLREYRHKPDMEGRISIKYGKKKKKVYEGEHETTQEAILKVISDNAEWIDDLNTYRKYAAIFGACEARNGEFCDKLEGAFTATEQPLPL